MSNEPTTQLPDAIRRLREGNDQRESQHEQLSASAPQLKGFPPPVGAVLPLAQADAMPICAGVYRIYCLRTRQSYYGSSLDVCNRAVHHRDDLRAKRHSNYRLQRAYDAFGEDSLTVQLVEQLPADVDQLVAREGEYIRRTRSYVYGIGFNIQANADYRKDRRHAARSRREEGEPLIWLKLPGEE